MPTFHDPRADASEASEALRGLAHASRVFDDPADTYTVFGDLVAGVRSLRQVLDQLATTHLNARDRVSDDHGDPAAGSASALAAADELHQAGTLLDQAYDRLDAAFTHSGRIAWHPAPVVDRDATRQRLAARLGGGPTTTTVQAGSLTLAVWPDAPVGEHQRYAYRITDTNTGQELEARDLFTGAGQPVEPDHAIRDLATFLGAAGEARQYVLDHPGSTPEHEGLFPAWVAEAARTNTDALTQLSEYDPAEPESEPTAERRWLNVVFLQGEDADQVLDLIDRDGTDAAIEELAGHDQGDETTDAAMENGYVYDDQPPASGIDRTATSGEYALTYNHALAHVGLYREYATPPDPALYETDTPTTTNLPIHRTAASAVSREASAVRRAALGADRDWFAHPAAATSHPGRGLSR